MRLFVVKLALVLSLAAPVAAQHCTPQSVPYPGMGVNFPDPHAIPWINLWHCMNPWHTLYNDGFEVGGDGWPVAGRTHNVRIGADVSMGMINEPGVYTCSYKGTADQILVSGGPMREGAGAFDGVWHNIQENHPEPGYTYFEIHCADTPKTIGFTIDGHIEDVKIMRPGYDLDETRTIDPRYTDLLADFTTLRFMPYLSANTHQVDNQWDCNGPASIDWEDRASPNNPQTLNGRKGGAWEWAVEICNELDKDMWINVPLIASDQYVRELAKHIKGNLKPTLNVNIELGNETWNTAGGFCCFRQLQDHFCGDNWGCHQRWPAKRLKTVVDIFAEVFGWSEINNRIRAILCGQVGYASDGHGWTIKAGLRYLEDSVGEGTARKYLYAVGAAPYFNARDATDGVTTILDSMESSIDNYIFGEFSNEYHSQSDQYMGNKLEGWLGEAGQYGLKLYAYEGGPDMDYTSGGADDHPDKLAAMKDPRMTALVEKYFTKWYSWYGHDALFCYFGGWFNESGLYTLGEDLLGWSTRQEAIDRIVNNPTPSWDTTYRQVIPGDFEFRKVSSYWSGWDRDTVMRYLRGELASPDWHPGRKWTFAAQKNGTYALAIRHNCVGDSKIDIYMDGVKIYDRLVLPRTGTVEGDWSSTTPTWSDSQGVTIRFDLSYGIHVMRIEFREHTDMSIHGMRWELLGETPPFQPEPVSGELNTCLGNPMASYSVEIDESVCEYEWDESAIAQAGAGLLPPAGGSGSVRTGQGTNTIYIDWSGVPQGAYTLRVRGRNDVGVSPWRDFTVSLTTCGFSVDPNPACVDEPVTFTPQSPPTTSRWSWDFGAAAYPRVVTDSGGGPVDVTYTSPGSKAVKLTILDSNGTSQSFITTVIVGSTEPGSASASPTTLNAGDSALITLSGHRGLVMRWQRSGDGRSWSDIASADLPYNTGPMAQSAWYRAVVRDGGCAEQVSSPVQVVVTNPVRAGTVQRDTTICTGQSPGPLRLTDFDGTIVRWEQSTFPFTNWIALSVTADSYTPGVLDETTQYRAVVAIFGTEYRSQPATVTVTAMPGVGAISGPTEVCRGQTGLTYSVQPVAGATAYSWTVPPGARIRGTADTSTITVDFDAAALSGDVTVTVAAACGPGTPAVLTVAVGGAQVESVSYTDPTACTTTDGVVTIVLVGTPPAGTYEIDLNADGFFEQRDIPLSGDTLRVTGFGNGETVTNVSVRRTGSVCPSEPYTTAHTFEQICAYNLAIPTPSHAAGDYRDPAFTLTFAPSSQDSVRDIFYVLCDDTIDCALTTLNGLLYDSSTGIPIDLSSGRTVVIFQARPKEPYATHWSPSLRDTLVFTYRPGFTVVSAHYFDGDADGRADRARFGFDRDIVQAPQQVALAAPPDGDPGSPGALVVAPTAMSPRVYTATFASQQLASVVTGWSDAPLGRIIDSSGFFTTEPFLIGDSIAPVIVSATYRMSADAVSGVFFDTIRVVFSEPVDIGGTAPCAFSGALGVPQLYDMEITGAVLLAIVRVSSDDRTRTPAQGDSIRISTGGMSWVTDKRNITQSSPGNRRVALDVRPPPDVFELSAGPTLFNPAQRSFLVVARANERIGELDENAAGTVTIYDGLGNIVLDMPLERDAGRLTARWNGRNRSNSVVGQGTYLAIVTVRAAGVDSERRIKIGVDR